MGSRVVITAIIVILAAIGATTLWFSVLKQTTSQPAINYPNATSTRVATSSPSFNTHGPCLASGEYADYPLNQRMAAELGLPASNTVMLSVRDRQTTNAMFSFEIADIDLEYHAIELHKCGVYVQRGINYDYNFIKHKSGATKELWKYSYDGRGEKLLTIALVDQSGSAIYSYESDFRVDPAERSLVVMHVVADTPSDSGTTLIIKDLVTKKDIFVLPLSEIINVDSNYAGDFGLEAWTKDGSYFWADTLNGAVELAFIRIDPKTGEYKILPAPEGMKGGDLFNPENGFVTYINGANPWTGDASANSNYQQTFQKEGKIASFYLHDLFTKAEYLLATSTDPLVRYRPQWLSDTVLQYTLPSGLTTKYTIPQ